MSKDLTLNKYLKEQLKDPEFKKEWKKSQMLRQLKGLKLAYESDMKVMTLKGKGYISIPKRQLYSVLVFIMRIYRKKVK